MTVGDRIRKLRKEKGISVDKLAELIGKDRATVYRYESQDIEKMPTSVLEPLAKALGTTPAYLMGWNETENKSNDNLNPLPKENIYMRPLYDSVAAGLGVPAVNQIVSYIPTFINNVSEKDKYIWVRVEGDSMAPKIENGDKILIRLQDSVDSGQIGVVLIDGEDAVVKKIVYDTDWIELESFNPYYPPRRFEGADVQQIRVVGLVREVSKELQ